MGLLDDAYEVLSKVTEEQASRHFGPMRDFLVICEYLLRYGYLDKTQVRSWLTVGEALERFQDFMGNIRTGTPTTQDWAIIRQPRCGCPDFFKKPPLNAHDPANPWIRYYGHETEIRVGFKSYHGSLRPVDQRSALQAACDSWNQHLDTKLVVATSPLDISIGTTPFGQIPSDGRGGMLAATYLPGHALPIPMAVDTANKFSPGVPKTGGRANLQGVFAHELGHCLGLTHSSPSDDVKSLMDPFALPHLYEPQPEDIKRAVAIGWRRRETTPPEERPPKTGPAGLTGVYQIEYEDGRVVRLSPVNP